MSGVTTRTRTTTRHEYVLSSPATSGDLMTAIGMAMKEMPENRRRYDDACFIESCDDEIVIWWPENEMKET